jgi:hypothetical protein
MDDLLDALVAAGQVVVTVKDGKRVFATRPLAPNIIPHPTPS